MQEPGSQRMPPEAGVAPVRWQLPPAPQHGSGGSASMSHNPRTLRVFLSCGTRKIGWQACGCSPSEQVPSAQTLHVLLCEASSRPQPWRGSKLQPSWRC